MLEKLSNLIVDSKEFSIVDTKAHRFCPFEAVGMARQEIRHSNFLAYLLDPSRPHGIGDVALRALLMSLTQEFPAERLDYHLCDLSKATVWRERDNIDLLIEIPSVKGKKGLVVAIEVKVDASEREGQLGDYSKRVGHRYSSGEWAHLFCFLTPDGRDGTTHRSQTWRRLSFGDLLDRVQAMVSRSGIAGEGVKFFNYYHSMMRRHGMVKGSSDPELDRAVLAIWTEHKEALDYLIDNRPDPFSAVMQKLDDRQKEFAKSLSADRAETIAPDQKWSGYRRFTFPSLKGECPALFGAGDHWVPSGSHLALELNPEKDQVMVCFVIGPEGNGKKFRSLLSEEMAILPATPAKYIKGPRHYWKEPVLTWDDLAEDRDHYEILAEKTRAFVDKHFDDVTKAVRSACSRLSAGG